MTSDECPSCGGSGIGRTGDTASNCPDCGGSGQVDGMHVSGDACPCPAHDDHENCADGCPCYAAIGSGPRINVARAPRRDVRPISGERVALIATEAVREVRRWYDESIFPPRPPGVHTEVYDGEAAAVARQTCDNVIRTFTERMTEAYEEGQLDVSAVSPTCPACGQSVTNLAEHVDAHLTAQLDVSAVSGDDVPEDPLRYADEIEQMRQHYEAEVDRLRAAVSGDDIVARLRATAVDNKPFRLNNLAAAEIERLRAVLRRVSVFAPPEADAEIREVLGDE